MLFRSVVAHAVQQGRDARTLTEEIVRHLRDCFLSLMAPELVQLPAQRAAEVTDLATRLGAAAIVRSMERLGEMLVEMRHAPDPRLLLEVALVQLTHTASSVDISVLQQRLERLEHQVAAGAAAPAPRPSPIDPSTGRVALGGRARVAGSMSTGDSTAPSGIATPTQPAAPAAPAQPAAAPAPPVTPVTPSPAASGPADTGALAAKVVEVWGAQVLSNMKALARAIVSATRVVGARDGAVVLAAPNEAHRSRAKQCAADLDAAIVKAVGASVPVVWVVDGDEPEPAAGVGSASTPAVADAADDELVVDLDDLVDVPPESVRSPADRLLEVFPGSKMIEE